MNEVLAPDTSVDASNKNLQNFKNSVIEMYNFVIGNSKSSIQFPRIEKLYTLPIATATEVLLEFQHRSPNATEWPSG